LPGLGDGVHVFGDLELHLHGGTYDLYQWVNVSLPLEFHLTPNQWWQAWVNLNAATAQQEGLQSALYHLYEQLENPQDLQAQADGALAAQAQSSAQVAAAQAQVDGLAAGASPEQIAALQARVSQVQAVLDSLLTQRGLMEIASPLEGVTLELAIHQGEVAAPGAALLTVADLSTVNLVVYLPETKIGQVQLGQEVQVMVDSFPGQAFEGQVVHIADRAEFTPRNVATQEERANLVFAVEVRIPNDEGLLKPGMPADARFE
jgi:multidrug resistance efflux pump